MDCIQALLSVGFSRQEYLSGLPFPTPRDLPEAGIESASPVSPAVAGGFRTTERPQFIVKEKYSLVITIGFQLFQVVYSDSVSNNVYRGHRSEQGLERKKIYAILI